MEEPGVDNGVKSSADLVHPESIMHHESCGKAAFCRLRPGEFNHSLDHIHPKHFVAAFRKKDGVVTFPAPDIEHRTDDLPRFLEADYLPLWPPDVPGGCPQIRIMKKTHAARVIAGRGDEVFAAAGEQMHCRYLMTRSIRGSISQSVILVLLLDHFH